VSAPTATAGIDPPPPPRRSDAARVAAGGSLELPRGGGAAAPPPPPPLAGTVAAPTDAFVGERAAVGLGVADGGGVAPPLAGVTRRPQ